MTNPEWSMNTGWTSVMLNDSVRSSINSASTVHNPIFLNLYLWFGEIQTDCFYSIGHVGNLERLAI